MTTLHLPSYYTLPPLLFKRKFAKRGLSALVQVRMSDLESENPSRNESLLKEIAQKTDGEYFDSPYLAVSEADAAFFDRFPVRS